MTKVKSPFDERDVSPLSNGDKVPCEVAPLNVSIWGVQSVVAGIYIENFKIKLIDYRNLLGYLIYYREAQKNVTIFDGRNACSKNEWKVFEYVDSDESSSLPSHPNDKNITVSKTTVNETHVKLGGMLPYVQHIITNLKPFTRYALYVKTYMIRSESKGAQSEIIYFKTLPARKYFFYIFFDKKQILMMKFF